MEMEIEFGVMIIVSCDFLLLFFYIFRRLAVGGWDWILYLAGLYVVLSALRVVFWCLVCLVPYPGTCFSALFCFCFLIFS